MVCTADRAATASRGASEQRRAGSGYLLLPRHHRRISQPICVDQHRPPDIRQRGLLLPTTFGYTALLLQQRIIKASSNETDVVCNPCDALRDRPELRGVRNNLRLERASASLSAHIAPLSACNLQATETGCLHRHVGTRPGYGEPLLRHRRQFMLTGSLQAFVIAAQTPDIVGVLT